MKSDLSREPSMSGALLRPRSGQRYSHHPCGGFGCTGQGLAADTDFNSVFSRTFLQFALQGSSMHA